MRDDYKPVLQVALKIVQILCWVGYGILLSLFFALLFNALPLITPMLVTSLPWLVRAVSLVLLFLATAALIEAIG